METETEKEEKGLQTVKKVMHRALEHRASQSNSSFRWIKFEKKLQIFREICHSFQKQGRLYHLLRGDSCYPEKVCN